MDSKKIGDKLTKLRGNKPQSEVAKACNISVSAICMYETGERIPRDEIKVRLARYYNVTVESIFYT